MLKTNIFYSLNVVQFTNLFMNKFAKRTINNRDPRTIMTMPYSGKGSEIIHGNSRVKDLFFFVALKWYHLFIYEKSRYKNNQQQRA